MLDLSDVPQTLLCTEDGVSDIIVSLNTTGPDKISARMLKGTASAIAPGMAKLFNISLTTGYFPDA